MSRNKVNYKIGFEDGEILSFTKIEDATFIVKFRTWNEIILEISFHDTIRILDNNMYSISDLVLINHETIFRKDALKMMFDKIPTAETYKHYQFLNQEDDPAIEIVAREISIREAESPV